MTAEDIKIKNNNNKVVDLRKLQSEAQRRQLMATLSLASLRIHPRPAPLWHDPAFLAGV